MSGKKSTEHIKNFLKKLFSIIHGKEQCFWDVILILSITELSLICQMKAGVCLHV